MITNISIQKRSTRARTTDLVCHVCIRSRPTETKRSIKVAPSAASCVRERRNQMCWLGSDSDRILWPLAERVRSRYFAVCSTTRQPLSPYGRTASISHLDTPLNLDERVIQLTNERPSNGPGQRRRRSVRSVINALRSCSTIRYKTKLFLNL